MKNMILIKAYIGCEIMLEGGKNAWKKRDHKDSLLGSTEIRSFGFSGH